MCFTPAISLTTAIIEFVIATFILIKYKDYLIPAFSAIFIYILGLYQLTEFMLCTANNPHFWATMGFATYTFLPAIGVHLSMRFTETKFRNYLLYIPAIIFTLIAFLNKNFITETSCLQMFVLVKTIFFSTSYLIPTIIYVLYYSGFFLIAGFILIKYFRRKDMRKIYLWWVSIGFITIIFPLILILVVPSLGLQFPSIYCEFAILFTIAALISSEIYSRKKKKEHLIE